MTDHHDVVAAFVDNEPVQADDLAAALAATEGREYLIDLLVLRGLVSDPSVRVHALGVHGGGVNGASGLPWPERSRGQSRGRQSRVRAWWLTAAAAVLVAGVAGGFFAGRGTIASKSFASPPVASDVTEPAASSSRPAPAPTHVIRMEKGVDWNERSGGN